MTLYRFICEKYSSHTPVLISVDGKTKGATISQVDVVCPDCERSTEKEEI
jgi:hypothetical protein